MGANRIVARATAALLLAGVVAVWPDARVDRDRARPAADSAQALVDSRSAVGGDELPAETGRLTMAQATIRREPIRRPHRGASVAHDAVRPQAQEIGFGAPRDFPTLATPSADAFNQASGDQLDTQLLHYTFSDGVAVGDFNRDKVDDVAVTNVLAGSVSVFLGRHSGGFATPQQYGVGAQPNFVVAGRFDRDRDLDLAVANFASHSVSILRGDGTGRFRAGSTIPVPYPRNVAAADLNGDAVPDLVIASGGPRCISLLAQARCTESVSPVGGVAMFAGSAAGNDVTFTPTQFLTHTHSADGQPVGANFVAVGDFNHDQYDDVAVAVGASANAGDRPATAVGPTGDDVLIYLNRGGAGKPFADAPSQPALRVGATPEAIAVGDFNGDADPDLAVVANANGDLTTLVGSRTGRFRVAAHNVTGGGLPRTLQVGDFDGDGVADLVTASFASSTISTFRGNGDATFQPAVDFWVGDSPTAVGVGEFGGDDGADIAVGRLRNDKLTVLVNDAPARGDGVAITRDIFYRSAEGNPFAAHNTLDVYVPPGGAPSFSGASRPYPVFLFAHGGANVTCDKDMVSYLMRSLARAGIIGVSMNYRLTGAGPENDVQTAELADAFGWLRGNMASFGGDPVNIFVSGTSGGAALVLKFVTEQRYAAEQARMAGVVVTGAPASWAPGGVASIADPTHLPPSLLLNGSDGLDRALAPASAAFAAVVTQRGGDSTHVVVAGRDHISVVSNIAVPGDLGREATLRFIRAHIR